MPLHKPAIIVSYDEFLHEALTSFLEYCKDLEQSIHDLSTAIENRRKSKAAKQQTLKKDL